MNPAASTRCDRRAKHRRERRGSIIITGIWDDYQQNNTVGARMTRFPILMYHRISSPDCPVPREAVEEERYAIPLPEFAWQIDRMNAAGYRGVSVGEVFDAAGEGKRIPENWVVLTFDDGNRSDFVHALPLLNEKGFSATFFVGTSRVGSEGGLEAEMIGEMATAGMEIGSHGMSHRFLPSLAPSEEAEECTRSRQVLSGLSGREVRFFALPGGRFSTRTIHALRRSGYTAVCTSKFGYNSGTPSFLLKRIPIHGRTARTTFQAVLNRSIARLIPDYCRTTAAAMTRSILGEKMYKKIRAAGLRG